jgi:hypothetical protein
MGAMTDGINDDTRAKIRAAYVNFGHSRDQIVATCERLVAEAVAAEREEWRVTYERAILRAEAAEAELSHVDAVLTRRPALDDLPNRTSKIEKAINAAKRTDALDEALGLLGFYLPVKP